MKVNGILAFAAGIFAGLAVIPILEEFVNVGISYAEVAKIKPSEIIGKYNAEHVGNGEYEVKEPCMGFQFVQMETEDDEFEEDE